MDPYTRRLDAVRLFNRFYTKHVGALNEGLLKSRFSLTEMRILYELHAHPGRTAVEICTELGLDRAYLSRLLKKFKKEGLVQAVPSETDGRQSLLSLSPQGLETFTPFIEASRQEVADILDPLPDSEQLALLRAMQTIYRTLAGTLPEKAPFSLRGPRPGDISWIAHRHARLYWEEYGFDEHFETMVMNIGAEFLAGHDPEHDKCWIAERDEEILGSVFLVRHSPHEAQLRLLYVEPTARGEGIGGTLINECIQQARRNGYSNLFLWTHDILTPAIRLYKAAGFTLVHEQKQDLFGQQLNEQRWDLML